MSLRDTPDRYGGHPDRDADTQPDHGGQDLIPRPERTPEAVRTALARIAPHRLDEMERHKEQAQHQAALTAVHGTTSKADPAFREGMNELAAVESEAVQAVCG
ncbi:hypothetical protein ACWD25_06340 [Streptomyces sp. NPDC002920]